MNYLALKRREFLRLSFLAGLLGLTGCGIESEKLIIRGSKGVLDNELLNQLPSSWQFKYLASELSLPADYFSLNELRTDLLVVEDGWLATLPLNELLPIEIDGFSLEFNNQARQFLKLDGDSSQTKVLPLCTSPWVMLFRNGKPWIKQAIESWEVLLDPGLKGHVVFPNSPRLIMSLFDKIGYSDYLEKIVHQARAFDDRNALNWVLSGKAKVAVLPLNRCIKSLFRDPRLSVAMPQMGAPLNWTLLTRPKSSRDGLPISWLKKSWTSPSMNKLISQGFIGPFAYSELLKVKKSIRNDLNPVLLPPVAVWENCWSLLPLSDLEQKDLANRWNAALS